MTCIVTAPWFGWPETVFVCVLFAAFIFCVLELFKET